MYAQILSTLVEQSETILNRYSFGNNLKDIKQMINDTKKCSYNEEQIKNFINDIKAVQEQINELKNKKQLLVEHLEELEAEYFSFRRMIRYRIHDTQEKIDNIDEQFKDNIMEYALIINNNFPIFHFYNYTTSYKPKNALEILYESCLLEISRPVIRTMFQLGIISEREYLENKKTLKKRVKKFFIKEKRNIKETIDLLKNKVCNDVIYNCILPYM